MSLELVITQEGIDPRGVVMVNGKMHPFEFFSGSDPVVYVADYNLMDDPTEPFDKQYTCEEVYKIICKKVAEKVGS